MKRASLSRISIMNKVLYIHGEQFDAGRYVFWYEQCIFEPRIFRQSCLIFRFSILDEYCCLKTVSGGYSCFFFLFLPMITKVI